MAFSAADQSTLSGLRREVVHSTGRALRRYFQRSLWLGTMNRYNRETVVRIKDDQANGQINRRNLAQYIAASAPLHCGDAWGYIGRASSALLRGDPHRAFHLAYYAELRAAMALLATSGVGVFDKQHYVIDAPNSVKKLSNGQGTHVFAWEALDYWSRTASSGELFAKVIRPSGRSLEDWLQPVGGSAASAAQARDWFQQWGMDLQAGTDDRKARNSSSYRPDGIPVCWATSPSETLEFIRESWECLEPSTGSPFDLLDSHILRKTVETLHFSRSGSLPSGQSPAFVRLVDQILDHQNFTGNLRTSWFDFLMRARQPADPAIFDLSAISPGQISSDHLSIISRAILLLRLACGASSDLMIESGIQNSDLTFWREEVGVARGLWETGGAPIDFTDLYSDIAEALDDIEVFQGNGPPATQTAFKISRDLAHRLAVLASHERASLWTVAAA